MFCIKNINNEYILYEDKFIERILSENQNPQIISKKLNISFEESSKVIEDYKTKGVFKENIIPIEKKKPLENQETSSITKYNISFISSKVEEKTKKITRSKAQIDELVRSLKIQGIGDYNPKKDGHKQDFDSRAIINIKSCSSDSIYYKQAINYFYDKLCVWIKEMNYNISKDIVVCVVPGHRKKQKNTSGIAEIANKVCEKFNFENGVNCILRNKSVEKQATSKKRMPIEENHSSLSCENSIKIEDQKVLLLDDVTSSGNSFKAASYLLYENNAKEVIPLALGKTVRKNER